jgi:hypothetical protein
LNENAIISTIGRPAEKRGDHEFADRRDEDQHATGDDPGPGQRHCYAEKGLDRPAAEIGGGLQQ